MTNEKAAARSRRRASDGAFGAMTQIANHAAGHGSHDHADIPVVIRTRIVAIEYAARATYDSASMAICFLMR
jgi:hypothetical protein